MSRIFMLILSSVLILVGCGGGGGGDYNPVNLPTSTTPILPQEFIISGHTVYVVTENCEYTDMEDIAQNCLELSDENDLSGNNTYVFLYHTERPNSEDNDINKFSMKTTRLVDGETAEEDISLENLWGDSNANYIDLYIQYKVYDYSICGEYELEVQAIDKSGRTTPYYTHNINVKNNCNAYPQDFIITGNAVYGITENCEYTEMTDIINNCLELADENNLSGNNIYFLTYITEVPDINEYVIDSVHTQLTRLIGGDTTEWETNFDANPENKIPYINLYDPLTIYDNAFCGEYELEVQAKDTNDRTTPTYTYKINVTDNCLQ